MIKATVNHKAFEIEWDPSSKKMKSQGGYNNSCREIEFIKILKNLKTTLEKILEKMN